MRRPLTGGAFAGLVALLIAACGDAPSQPPGPVSTAPQGGVTTPTPRAGTSAFTISGTVKGKQVDATVSTTPTCTKITSGTVVIWSAADPSTGALAGEIDYGANAGTQRFPAGGSGTNLVVGGDYQNRFGAPSGSITVNTDLASGTIDAQISGNGSDSLHLTGTWKCS